MLTRSYNVIGGVQYEIEYPLRAKGSNELIDER